MKSHFKTEEPSSAMDDDQEMEPTLQSNSQILQTVKYICDICKTKFSEQYTFFEHLKVHYESNEPISTSSSMSDMEAATILAEASIPSTSNSQINNSRLTHVSVAAQSDPPHHQIQQDSHHNIKGSKTSSSKRSGPSFVLLEGGSSSSSLNVGSIELSNTSADAHSRNIGTMIDTPKLSLVTSRTMEETPDKVLLSCPKCKRTFRKEKTYQVHIDSCQKGDEEETRKPAKSKAKNKKATTIKANLEAFVVEETEVASENFLSESAEEPEDMEDDPLGPSIEFHGEEDGEGILVEEELICPGCDEVYMTSSSLEEHMAKAHPNVVFPLNISNKKTSKKKVAGQRRNEVLKCPECERIFNHRNSLVYHMRSHTGERPHQCELCGKSFFATSALKVHMRLHSGEKPYKCDHCGRHFRQWGDLKYHVISIHSDIRQYQCEFCGKDFARKYSLIVHRRIHTGERNYKCEFCGKCFRAASYLQNHRRIHTGEKPHACNICGKPFRVRSDMKRHMASHTRDHHNHSSHTTAAENSTSISNSQVASHSHGPTVVTVSTNADNQLVSTVGSQMSAQLVQTSRNGNQTIQIPVSGSSGTQLVHYEVQHLTLDGSDDNVISGDLDAQPINITASDGTLSVAAVATLQAADIPEGVIYQNRDGIQMEAVTIRESSTGTLYVWPVFMN